MLSIANGMSLVLMVMHVSAVPLMRNKNAELVVSSEGAVTGNDENQGKHVNSIKADTKTLMRTKSTSRSGSQANLQSREEQMLFVHRKGDVQLEFSTKTFDPENNACVLQGTLIDKDYEAGDLNIHFSVDYLWYNVTDTVTGGLIYEERKGPPGEGVETLRLEDENFVIATVGGQDEGDEGDEGAEDGDDDGEEEEDGDSLAQGEGRGQDKKPKNGKALVHIGTGSLLESHETHWERVIDNRSSRGSRQWLKAQEKASNEKFNHALETLLSDSRGNALMELAVAFSNAGVSGASYPCAFPLMSLVQNMRKYGKKMSSQTLQDVQDKEDAAAVKNGRSLLEKSNGSTASCNGCSNSCGNTCFGMCGAGCSHWTFVCRESPETAFLGCCAHDGYCSCGGMTWYNCWAFLGNCDTVGCAASQCTICTSCTGNTYQDHTRRRRRWFPPRRRRSREAEGQCTQCAKRSGEPMDSYVARCFPR